MATVLEMPIHTIAPHYQKKTEYSSLSIPVVFLCTLIGVDDIPSGLGLTQVR